MKTETMVPVYVYKNSFTGEVFTFTNVLTESEMVFLDLVWSHEEQEVEMTIGKAMRIIEGSGYVIKNVVDDVIHCMTGDTFHSFRIKRNKLQKYNYFAGEWEVFR